jgi:hypothetical protein
VPTVGYNQSQAYRRFTSRLFRRRKIADVINDLFESVHNYISDDNIIPKGAISARKGEKCIILYGGVTTDSHSDEFMLRKIVF